MVLVVATLATLCTFTSSAANFKDISAKDEALYDAVQLLNSLGIAKGQSETNYGANKPVTREQMAAFIYRLMKGGKSLEGGENLSGFTDLKDPTFYGMISWASDNGVIKGRSATEFDPAGKISLQDCYVMITRALGYEKDGALAYPHEYIDIAERIGLDENIDAKVKYTDDLNRGQVALILYNAFYAEMNETYRDLFIPAFERDDIDSATQFVYVDTPETVCHKIYGIEEIVRRVVATPNYAIDISGLGNTSEYKAYKPLGGENVDEVLIETAAIVPEADSARLANEESVLLFEDLGLEGEADDYFLRDITMYVKEDGTVLAAFAGGKYVEESVMNIQTRSGDDKDRDFYGSTKDIKLRTGIVTFGSDKAYFWNKPESVPNYAVSIAPVSSDDEGRITFKAGLTWAGYVVPALPEGPSYISNPTGWKTQQDANHTALTQITSTGWTGSATYHNVEYYDSNSDGNVDYLWVQPFTFGKIVDKKGDTNTLKAKHTGDSKNRAYFNSSKAIPEIYVGEATVEGGAHEDGKWVFAYVSAQGNYIRVAKDEANAVKVFTAEPKSWTGTDANSVKWSDGSSTNTWNSDNQIVGHVNLSNGMPTGLVPLQKGTGSVNGDADSATRWTAATSFASAFQSAMKTSAGVTWEIVSAHGRVMVAKKLAKSVEVAKQYAVIQYINEDKLQVVFKGGGIDMAGSLEVDNYVRAFIDGKFQLVKIANNSEHSASGYQDDNYFVDEGLVNNISTYTVNGKGEYTFEPFAPTSADAVASDLTNKEDATITYTTVVDGISLKQFQNKLYQFVSSTSVPAELAPNGMKYVTITDETKIIVNFIDEDGYSDFAIYDAANLPDFDYEDPAMEFTKAVVVLQNNVNSTANENLAFLYCEIGGEIVNSSAATENYSIILGSIETVDADNKSIIVYKVVDPKTGEIYNQKETAKESSIQLDTHALYVLTEDGFIKNTDAGKLASLAYGSTDLVALASYEAEEGILVLADSGETTVLTDENTIYALYDRDTMTVTIEDAEMLTIEAADDEDNDYYNEGETALTMYVISEDRKGEDFEFATLVIVAKG